MRYFRELLVRDNGILLTLDIYHDLKFEFLPDFTV